MADPMANPGSVKVVAELVPAVSNLKRWLITTAGAVLAGGVTGMITAACDPSKYRFPQDFGSGKLWPFFFTGAGLTFFGVLIRSPFGQKIMAGFHASQAQLKQTQLDIEKAKSDLRDATRP